MANANKRKGDAAERAVRDFVKALYPESFKTRAGFNDDLGDIIVEHPGGRVVLQVKDVKSPNWKQWFEHVAVQVRTCRRHSDAPVLGGAIVHKTRGKGNPGVWRAILELREFLALIDAAYAAGHLDGEKDGSLGSGRL